MPAKLVIGLLVLALLITLVMGIVFMYFTRKAELSHEEKMRRMDRDEEILSSEFDSIDRELERDRE